MGFLQTGVVDKKEIRIPPEERFQKGPVAIIECVQKIPCNPCVESCPKGAISIKGSINNIPEVDFDLCNGCGSCLANCPGLAIFLVDKSHDKNKSTVSVPYEFKPLPEKGEKVHLLNRSGQICGKGEVVKVRNARVQDRTPIVTLAMDKPLTMEVRFFRRIINEQ
jgi:Fe-S-cluster-containing hydrogenase component 2